MKNAHFHEELMWSTSGYNPLEVYIENWSQTWESHGLEYRSNMNWQSQALRHSKKFSGILIHSFEGAL